MAIHVTLPTDPTPPAPHNEGIVVTIVNAVKTMSLTQTLIIALLVMIAIPTYVLWRALNDQSMLNTFLSRYEEYDTKSSCTLRVASIRGGGDTWAVSTGLAIQGSDRYVVTVILAHRPDEQEIHSFCETLNLIVDHMRRPAETPPPTFPNSTEPLIWKYPPDPPPQ